MSDPAPPLWPRSSPVGPYRLLRRIGQGGMAEAHEAVYGGSGFEKRVAIKMLRSELLGAAT